MHTSASVQTQSPDPKAVKHNLQEERDYLFFNHLSTKNLERALGEASCGQSMFYSSLAYPNLMISCFLSAFSAWLQLTSSCGFSCFPDTGIPKRHHTLHEGVVPPLFLTFPTGNEHPAENTFLHSKSQDRYELGGGCGSSKGGSKGKFWLLPVWQELHLGGAVFQALHWCCVPVSTHHQGKPWGKGESPDVFFVPLPKAALVSLPVGTDSHQTLQKKQLALVPSCYNTPEHVHSQGLSQGSTGKKGPFQGIVLVNCWKMP